MIGRIPIYIFEDFVIITEEIIGDFLLILKLFSNYLFIPGLSIVVPMFTVIGSNRWHPVVSVMV